MLSTFFAEFLYFLHYSIIAKTVISIKVIEIVLDLSDIFILLFLRDIRLHDLGEFFGWLQSSAFDCVPVLECFLICSVKRTLNS